MYYLLSLTACAYNYMYSMYVYIYVRFTFTCTLMYMYVHVLYMYTIPVLLASLYAGVCCVMLKFIYYADVHVSHSIRVILYLIPFLPGPFLL